MVGAQLPIDHERRASYHAHPILIVGIAPGKRPRSRSSRCSRRGHGEGRCPPRSRASSLQVTPSRIDFYKRGAHGGSPVAGLRRGRGDQHVAVRLVPAVSGKAELLALVAPAGTRHAHHALFDLAGDVGLLDHMPHPGLDGHPLAVGDAVPARIVGMDHDERVRVHLALGGGVRPSRVEEGVDADAGDHDQRVLLRQLRRGKGDSAGSSKSGSGS